MFENSGNFEPPDQEWTNQIAGIWNEPPTKMKEKERTITKIERIRMQEICTTGMIFGRT